MSGSDENRREETPKRPASVVSSLVAFGRSLIPARVLALAFAFLLAFGLISCGDGDESPSPLGDAAEVILDSGSGSGVIEVAGTAYEFEATTCVIEGDAFVMAGPGIDSESGGVFFVTVEDADVAVAFEVTSGTDEPPTTARWFRVRESDLSVVGDTAVTGSAQFFDSHGDLDATHEGSVDVVCESVTEAAD